MNLKLQMKQNNLSDTHLYITGKTPTITMISYANGYDIVFFIHKNNTILWFENKDRDTIADYKKVFSLSLERKNLLEQINQVYPDKLASNLFFAIAHFGESKYLKKVTEYNISTILQVVSPLPDPQINILFDPLVIFS